MITATEPENPLLSQTLRYLWAAFRNPDAKAFGVLPMGLGIENRRARYARFWDSHLENTRATQRRWRDDVQLRSSWADITLLVLGAGRLYDFEAALAETCRQVILCDVDPLCVPVWRQFAHARGIREARFEVRDLSGSLLKWQKQLNAIVTAQSRLKQSERWKLTLSQLSEISTIHSSPLKEFVASLRSPVAVLSLNLLSQIPILWQDMVEKILNRHFSAAWVREHEDEWIAAFSPSAKLLVEQHLRELDADQIEAALILTDLEYGYYNVPRESLALGNGRCPIRYDTKAKAPWSFEPWAASKADVTPVLQVLPALYGAVSAGPKFGVPLQHPLRDYASWLWHLVPQYEEDPLRGIVHRVAAFERI